MSPLLAAFGAGSAKAFGLSRFLQQDLGDFESIATVSVGSGGTSSIVFNNIPSTYTDLQIRGILRDNRGVSYSAAQIRFNSDSQTSYAYHTIYGDNRSGSINSSGASSQTAANIDAIVGNTVSSGVFAGVIIDIADYSNQNKNKTIKVFSGNQLTQSGNAGIIGGTAFGSGLWVNTSAITSITITPITTPFLENSHLALYGIKE